MGRSIICIGKGGLGKAFEESGVICLDRQEADISDICTLKDVFEQYEPLYVINCAGVVGTAKCEHEPEIANVVNIGGVANLVYMCKKYNANLVHISTIYVGEYNVYTRSKKTAENIILDSDIKSWIVRIPWLFGAAVDNFILSAVKKKKVSIYDDEFGYLAYDRDIVDYVINNIGDSGLISIANDGLVNRADILRFISDKDFNILKRQIDMPDIAPAPDVCLRKWEEAMEEFINGFRTV